MNSKSFFSLLLVSIISLTFLTPCLATEVGEEQSAAKIESLKTLDTEKGPLSLTRLVRTVAAVIVVCALAVFILSRLAPIINRIGSSSKLNRVGEKNSRFLRLEESLILDKDNSMRLVSVDNDTSLLISLSPSGMKSIGYLDADRRFRFLDANTEELSQVENVLALANRSSKSK